MKTATLEEVVLPRNQDTEMKLNGLGPLASGEGKRPSPKVFLTLTAEKGEEHASAPGACGAGLDPARTEGALNPSRWPMAGR